MTITKARALLKDRAEWIARLTSPDIELREQGLAIELLLAATEWRPIASAPRDGRSILIAHPFSCAMEAEWDDVRQLWECGKLQWKEGDDVGPMWWMEMPMVPNLEGK